MKYAALLATATLLVGCADQAVEMAAGPETASTASESGSTPMVASYSAGDAAKLAIPKMHCPFGCFPAAKDALKKIDGISDVTLVQQKKEGVIDDRRVVVTFDGTVDKQAAITALDAVDLPGASFEPNTSSAN